MYSYDFRIVFNPFRLRHWLLLLIVIELSLPATSVPKVHRYSCQISAPWYIHLTRSAFRALFRKLCFLRFDKILKVRPVRVLLEYYTSPITTVVEGSIKWIKQCALEIKKKRLVCCFVNKYLLKACWDSDNGCIVSLFIVNLLYIVFSVL